MPQHERSPWRCFWELRLVSRMLDQRPSSEAFDGVLSQALLTDQTFAAQFALLHNVILTDEVSWQVQHLREWLLWCAWGQCQHCHTMYPRALRQAEFHAPVTARHRLHSTCWACRQRGPVPPLSAGLPPDFLQLLDREQQLSLRVIVLHQGCPKRHPHGYLRKDKLTAVSWQPQTVLANIQQLPGEKRHLAHQGYCWLLSQATSAYGAWIAAHSRHLVVSGRHSLPPTALLEPYLETAVFPHLYPSMQHCEKQAGPEWLPFSHRPSVKASLHESEKADFVRKLLSDIIDYDVSYELLQFQFDRYVLHHTIVTHAVAQHNDVKAKWALQHRHWTPGFWRRHHAILEDVSRQLGPPDLFITIAPWERDFPFPYWVRKAKVASGYGCFRHCAAETLSVAHALHQLVAGYMAGKSGPHRWTNHLLANQRTGDGNVKAFFARYEFQDGGIMHQYGKGRGSLHLHCLFWLLSPDAAALDQSLCAELPVNDPILAAVASRVQSSASATRAPVREDASKWSWDPTCQRWILQLRHTAAFATSRLRPFFKSLLTLLRCSQDVQWWHGRGALLQYVAGYVSKYAEGWNEDWLETDDSLQAGLAVARNWKAAAAEQVMTLARHRMAFSSVSAIVFVPPVSSPDDVAEVYMYRRRSTAESALCLLQWLRAFQVSGSLADRNVVVKKRQTSQLTAVGLIMSPITRDAYFRQWLLMFKPHRLQCELEPPIMQLVSAPVRFFAAATVQAPDPWKDDARIGKLLEAAGHRQEFVSTTVSRLRGLRQLIHGQVQGWIPRGLASVAPLSHIEKILSPAQQAFLAKVMCNVAVRAEAAEDVDTQLMPRTKYWRPLFLTGGPGTGKSFTIAAAASYCHGRGMRVLFANPTGMLATSVQPRLGMVSTTVHRAFGANVDGSFSSTPAILQEHDVWVVGELGMLPVNIFDQIIRAWLDAGRWPLLLFEGDFAQLPPVRQLDCQNSEFWPLLQRCCLPSSSFRSDDAVLLDFLHIIRSRTAHVALRCWQQSFYYALFARRPDMCQLRILWDKCLFSGPLDATMLLHAWTLLPEALCLANLRATCAWANDVGLQQCHGDELESVPAWDGEHISWLCLRRGARVIITRNLSLDDHLVNGTQAIVLDVKPDGVILEIPGRSVALLWRRAAYGFGPDSFLRHAYDLALGYAITVHKAEGQTLSSVILAFDGDGLPGAGYTALSRVKSLASCIMLGDLSPAHFQPRVR